MSKNDKQATKKPNKRHQSRAFAMQALFQWHFTDESPEMLMREFLEDHFDEKKNLDLDYFKVLFFGVAKNIDAIDTSMTPLLDRQISALNPIELSVLRLAIYELKYQLEVPPAVVMNEAIELAKEFGSQDGYKFVNGVLNAMVHGK